MVLNLASVGSVTPGFLVLYLSRSAVDLTLPSLIKLIFKFWIVGLVLNCFGCQKSKAVRIRQFLITSIVYILIYWRL